MWSWKQEWGLSAGCSDSAEWVPAAERGQQGQSFWWKRFEENCAQFSQLIKMKPVLWKNISGRRAALAFTGLQNRKYLSPWISYEKVFLTCLITTGILAAQPNARGGQLSEKWSLPDWHYGSPARGNCKPVCHSSLNHLYQLSSLFILSSWTLRILTLKTALKAGIIWVLLSDRLFFHLAMIREPLPLP